MNHHPKIQPGRDGLPPTSNIAWSPHAERYMRWNCRVALLLALVMAGFSVFAMVTRDWGVAGLFFAVCLVALGLVYTEGQRFYAILLNKPRDPSALTEWTEHIWTGWDPQRRRIFMCACGRTVDLYAATFFLDTKRYARVCECGRGHFLVPPVSERNVYRGPVAGRRP